jgi:uncharacterized protein YjbJ (UPF0337 family)
MLYKEEFCMNAEEMHGKWNQFKGAVKQRWAQLTDDDIAAIDGHRDRLVGKIQERYGITKEKAEQQFDEWKMPSAGVATEEPPSKRRAS